MTDLLILADRVEGLSGPDACVDRAIRDALGLPNDYGADWGSRGNEVPAAFPYTASIDAAMTLVPEGLRLMLSEWDDEKHLRPRGPWQAVLSLPGADASFDLMRGYRCEHAATPALALTAACLRTIAANQEKP